MTLFTICLHSAVREKERRKSKRYHINEETGNYFLAHETDHLKQIQLLQNELLYEKVFQARVKWRRIGRNLLSRCSI